MKIHYSGLTRKIATNTSFITVSFKDPGKPDQPGNYDPSVALKLYEHSTQNGLIGPGDLAGPSKNPWYYAFLGMYQNLQESGVSRYTWWDMVARAMKNEMTYTCDAKLGTPSESDCNELPLSQLGPTSDFIRITPHAPVIRTTKSCSISIQSTTRIFITWSQIATALEVLLQVCVKYRSMKAGGWANFDRGQPMPAPGDIASLAGASNISIGPDIINRPELSGMSLYPSSLALDEALTTSTNVVEQDSMPCLLA